MEPAEDQEYDIAVDAMDEQIDNLAEALIPVGEVVADALSWARAYEFLGSHMQKVYFDLAIGAYERAKEHRGKWLKVLEESDSVRCTSQTIRNYIRWGAIVEANNLDHEEVWPILMRRMFDMADRDLLKDREWMDRAIILGNKDWKRSIAEFDGINPTEFEDEVSCPICGKGRLDPETLEHKVHELTATTKATE